MKMRIIPFNANYAINLLIYALNAKIMKVVNNVKKNIFYQMILVNAYLHVLLTKVINKEFQYLNNNYFLIRI